MVDLSSRGEREDLKQPLIFGLSVGVIVLRVSSGLCLWCLVCSTVFCFAQESNETIFSGPQSGVIPALTVELLSGENRGATLDLTSHIDDRPSVLIFIHQLTRPGFGLMRTVGDFASKRPITSGQSAQNDASSEPSDETDKNADSESTSRKEKNYARRGRFFI